MATAPKSLSASIDACVKESKGNLRRVEAMLAAAEAPDARRIDEYGAYLCSPTLPRPRHACPPPQDCRVREPDVPIHSPCAVHTHREAHCLSRSLSGRCSPSVSSPRIIRTALLPAEVRSPDWMPQPRAHTDFRFAELVLQVLLRSTRWLRRWCRARATASAARGRRVALQAQP